jgi:hypothetical protein
MSLIFQVFKALFPLLTHCPVTVAFVLKNRPPGEGLGVTFWGRK